MRREKIVSAGFGALLAFCISLGALACLVTAFGIVHVDMADVVGFLLAFSLVAAACSVWKWGNLVLACIMAMVGGYLWRIGTLEYSVEALIYHITKIYDAGYGWGVAKWTGADPARFATTDALRAMAVPMILLITRAVCGRKRAISAVIMGFAPLVFCFIVTDTVPAEGWLGLLLAAQVLLILTQTVRRMNERDGNRLTAWMLIPAVLCTVLLFWAVPQNEYVPHGGGEILPGILDGFLPGPETGGVGSGSMENLKLDLSAVGPRTDRNVVVMEVTADRGGLIYLRGRAYEQYDGNTWQVIEDNEVGAEGWPQAGLIQRGQLRIDTRRVFPMQYMPYYADQVNWENYKNGSLTNGENKKEYAYTLMSLTGDAAATLSYTAREQNLQLPQSTKARAVKILEKLELYFKGKTESEKAEMIAQYVKDSATYSLETEKMPDFESDFAMWFLSQAETGYCVHFASATVVLLRAAGIPARYVTGYVAAATSGSEVRVMEKDAHAWAEYFTPETGWTVLESTPDDSFTEPSEPTEPTDTEPSEPTESTDTEPTEPGSQPTEAPTEPATESSVPETTQPTGGEQPADPPVDLGWLWNILKALGTVAAVCAALWGQFRIRVTVRRKRQNKLGSNIRALRKWREILWVSQCLQQTPPERLAELADRAKFSQHTLTSEEIGEFDAYLRQLSEILAQKNILQQLFYKLVYAIE